jgi:exodeoxyribonuclease-3
MRAIKLFCLSLILTASVCAEPLQVMTYNVWLGFNKKQTLPAGIEWIAAQNINVLALQELKGFNQQRLADAAKQWGHDYSVIFDRKGGFPQGLTSKTPIEKFAQIQPEGNPSLRGTLHCKTAGIHFFVVHFDPRNYLNRQKEVAAVAAALQPLLAADEKVIVLGDFNAHSIADKEFLEEQTVLLEKWRAKEAEEKSHRAFNKAGELDYSVLQALFDVGMIDPAETPQSTFPSRLNFPDTPQAEFEGLQQRLDFILVSENLQAGSETEYPRAAALDTISDHYPLLLELKL